MRSTFDCAVVTGAASGIGAALARRLHGRGARLVCLNADIVSTHPGSVWEAPHSEWQRVIGVNLGGVVNGLRAFVPRLLADGSP
ncbi:MAG: oxidoreductase, partial [Acidimicrobiales bacterium]